uniref:RING-type domain-containing protein n=1 Tax=Romanomermis culicivorax TaxID=13658 RepID=A0A915JMC2_ROMCU
MMHWSKSSGRTCPKCKSSDYNNRYFKLKINECGHSLCENCVENLFARQSGPCPTCGRTLKKSSFWEQMFDDPAVEKHTFYRKKLTKIFNLKLEDFKNLREFNDYLEMVETYAYNLAFDVDVDETKRKIEEFQQDNDDLIMKNKNKLSKDEEWINRMIEEEKQAAEKHGFQLADDQADRIVDRTDPKSQFEQDAKSVIAELMNSDTDASHIIGRKRYEALKLKEEADLKRAALGAKRSAEQAATLVRKKLRSVKTEEIVPLAFVSDGSPYVYVQPDLHINGPNLPNLEDLFSSGYLKHIKTATNWQSAGGYFEGLGCRRALMEAFCDLYC